SEDTSIFDYKKVSETKSIKIGIKEKGKSNNDVNLKNNNSDS
ncbi:21266_t:CDS:1, partial [Cetraspora pellucida]